MWMHNGERTMPDTRFTQLVEADLEGREKISPTEVLKLWTAIETHRAAIAERLAILQGWLDACPDFARDWNAFVDAGGVSVHELRNFLDGKVLRRKRMRTRTHLRMIVNNKVRAVRLLGDDAA